MNRNQITFLIYALIIRDRSEITAEDAIRASADDAQRLDAKSYTGAMYPDQWRMAQEITEALMPEYKPLAQEADSWTFGAIAATFAAYTMSGEHKIPCIRIIRGLTGSGLKPAKDFVECKTTLDGLKDGHLARLKQAEADCAQIREQASADLRAAKRREDRLRKETEDAMIGQARMDEQIDLLTRLADTQERLIKELE